MHAQAVPAVPGTRRDRPTALIIPSSAGYGLAATITGIARYGIHGVGLCFEGPPTDRRTATAGRYRTIATAELAAEAGSDFCFVNGDAFSSDTKQQVLDLVGKKFEDGIDYLIYSIATPRRTDPAGDTYQSVLKPLGQGYATKTLDFSGATRRCGTSGSTPPTTARRPRPSR